MDNVIDYSTYLTILGLLTTLTGIYKLHHSVKTNPATEITYHAKEPRDAAIIDYHQARSGLRFTIYGFLIQMLTVIF